MPWDARSCRYVFILREKIINGTRTKNIFLNEQKSRDAAAKKYRYKSRDK